MPAAAGAYAATFFVAGSAAAVTATAVASAVVYGAIAGAVIGAATALASGGDLGDVLKGGLKGALIGGVTGGVISGAGIAAGVFTPAQVSAFTGATAATPVAAAAPTTAAPTVISAAPAAAGAVAPPPPPPPPPAAEMSMGKALLISGGIQGLSSGIGAVGAAKMEGSAAEELANKKAEEDRAKIAANVPGEFKARVANVEGDWWNKHLGEIKRYERPLTGYSEGLLSRRA